MCHKAQPRDRQWYSVWKRSVKVKVAPDDADASGRLGPDIGSRVASQPRRIVVGSDQGSIGRMNVGPVQLTVSNAT